MPTYFQAFNRLDEAETEITVEYSISGGCAAQTYGPAENCYPAESLEVEIVSAWIDDGSVEQRLVALTDAEDEKFCTWIAENHVDDEPDVE